MEADRCPCVGHASVYRSGLSYKLLLNAGHIQDFVQRHNSLPQVVSNRLDLNGIGRAVHKEEIRQGLQYVCVHDSTCSRRVNSSSTSMSASGPAGLHARLTGTFNLYTPTSNHSDGHRQYTLGEPFRERLLLCDGNPQRLTPYPVPSHLPPRGPEMFYCLQNHHSMQLL